MTLRIDGRIYHIGDLRPGEKRIIRVEKLQTLELLSGGAVDLLITETSEGEKENPKSTPLTIPAVVAFLAFAYLLKRLKQRPE